MSNKNILIVIGIILLIFIGFFVYNRLTDDSLTESVLDLTGFNEEFQRFSNDFAIYGNESIDYDYINTIEDKSVQADMIIRWYEAQMRRVSDLHKVALQEYLDAPVDCQNAASMYIDNQDPECKQTEQYCCKRFLGICTKRCSRCITYGATDATVTEGQALFDNCVQERLNAVRAIEASVPVLTNSQRALADQYFPERLSSIETNFKLDEV